MLRKLVFPALVGLAAYYALFGGEYTLLDVREIHQRALVADTELGALRTETDSLRNRVEALERDPRTLEALARERFGMIRDGEVLYRFAEPEDEPLSSGS
jgi:cell division protein FtsB